MTPTLDLSDIQGNIISGYRHRCYKPLFGRVDDAHRWKRFLAELAVVSEARSHEATRAVNVGISFAGLAALAPDAAHGLSGPFPAFAAGMNQRAAALGDPADDRCWAPWKRRDIWISVYGTSPDGLGEEVIDLARKHGLELDGALQTGTVIERHGERVEHFGFRDGISNPVFEGARHKRPVEGNGKKNASGRWVPIRTGEFLLGYPNEQNIDPTDELSPPLPELLKNGTFAVFRDLEQHVEAFHGYVGKARSRFPAAGDLAEKMVGRTRAGRPLTAPGTLNDFDYHVDDPHGSRCPLGAHIRRANPRTSGEHRLLRRSMTYGSFVEPGQPAQGSRGIYFIAFNANIESQFEFLQRFYMNGLGGGQQDFGPVSHSRDPLAASGNGARRMAIEGDVASGQRPLLLLDIPNFVTTRGGQYYFVPSMNALELLSRDDSAPSLRKEHRPPPGEGVRP